MTTGFVIDRVKLEASAFNGREPNEERWSIQLAALDSWSGRAFVAPTSNWTAQYSIGRLEHPEALEPGSQWRQTASVEYNRPLGTGNWATSLSRGRVHKIATDTTLNSYLLESTLNFQRRNYAFSRLELVDKDELFPQAAVHPAYRIGAYTFGGVRDLIQDRAWQLGLGADVTFYSKPSALDLSYGNHPVSFQIFRLHGSASGRFWNNARLIDTSRNQAAQTDYVGGMTFAFSSTSSNAAWTELVGRCLQAKNGTMKVRIPLGVLLA